MPILIGAPVACADDEAVVDAEVPLLPAAVVVLLVEGLLEDEQAATISTVVRAHAP
jgi:hypothetical protein